MFLASVNPGFARMAAEKRDRAWVGALIARDIHNVDTPSLSPDFATDLKESEHFSRSEMYELLECAVRERDHQWRIWVDDPLIRHQSPSGPPPIELDLTKE
jgi:hypothetical protein